MPLARLEALSTHFDRTGRVTESLRIERPKKGEKMKVAVPYLAGQVNEHFGSTEAFLIVETRGDQIERTSIFEVQGIQHNHTGIAGFLQEQGVEVILAGGMGPPMQQALKRAGFRLYCGVSGPAGPAVEAFLRGDIEQSETPCTHHDCDPRDTAALP